MVTLQHTTWHRAMSTPEDGSLVELRRKMAKSMAGFLEKPTILHFTMFFNLGITTLSNIATPYYPFLGRRPAAPANPLFRCGAAGRQRSV
jgi:hypothetical protein